MEEKEKKGGRDSYEDFLGDLSQFVAREEEKALMDDLGRSGGGGELCENAGYGGMKREAVGFK